MRRLTETPDASVVLRLKQGDGEALRQVMEAYQDTVVAIAFRYVRSIDVAQDIAQDVFVGVWNRRDTLDPERDIARYLYRAARNGAIKVLERDATARRFAERTAQEHGPFGPDDENSGVKAVESEEAAQTIRRVLASLSPRVREVAGLYYDQGLEPGEIADMLGVAPRTVYNQLRTALKALFDAFK